MRANAAAWRNRAIVQEALAQFTWYHNVSLPTVEEFEAELSREDLE